MFNPGSQFTHDAQSPPLHHPVPQHPLPRSPPNFNDAIPAQAQAANPNPYAPATAYTGPSAQQQQQQQQTQDPPQAFGHHAFGAATALNSIGSTQQQTQPNAGFSGFQQYLNDPSAQIGLSVGRNALNYGQEYIGKNINQYISTGALKYYFQVSNSYVLRKIKLVLFPWRHGHWTRAIQRAEGPSQRDSYAPAREDINSPDMYIPAMAFTTYVFISCISAGLKGSYHPQLLGVLASKTIAFLIVELLFLKLGTYLLSAGSSLLDFAAYSGYKFIGIILTTLAYAIFASSKIKWAVFLYTATSNAFFLLRSLRYILLPDSNSVNSTTHTINPAQRQRRIHFLFVYSFIVQFVFMWFLV